MIAVFADPGLRALAVAIAQSPAQFGWLLDWQRARFAAALPPEQQSHFAATIGALIAANFSVQPSSGPAFMQMAAQFDEALKRNRVRLSQLAALDIPVKVIRGEYDPYLSVALGEERTSRFRNGSLYRVPAGHWVQSDRPDLVANLLLS